MYSPPISSSSSVLSSPQLGYTPGGEVPSLMPSALGSALKRSTTKSRYSVSSSSSASWSIFTDDEDQDPNHPYSSSSSVYSHDAPDPLSEPNVKVQNFINSVNASALSYTRIPSGTNNHSLVPQVKHHSSSRHVRGFPIKSLVLPDDGASSASDADFSSNDPLDSDSEANANSQSDVRLVTAKTKRSRNRASLPACFSLLQIASSLKPIRSPPVSSSSGNATVHQSPPTPKVPSKRPGSILDISPTIVPLSSLYDTPRGRRREAGHSSCGNRSNSSHSSSRRRRLHADDSLRPTDHPDGPSRERLFDWSGEGFAPIRGRLNVRRSSSPLSRKTPDTTNAELRPIGGTQIGRSRPRLIKGRARVEQADGVGSLLEAHGCRNGRSGVVDRERARFPL